jgi:hypothetical protein
VHILACSPHETAASPLEDAGLLEGMRGRWPVLWIRMAGAAEARTLHGLRGGLGLPAAIAETLLDPAAPSLAERVDDHLIVHLAWPDARAAVVVGPDHVLTLGDPAPDPFAALVEAVTGAHGRLRRGGSGDLAVLVLQRLFAVAMQRSCDSADAVGTLEAHADVAGLARLPPLRDALRAAEAAAGAVAAAAAELRRAPEPLVPAAAVDRLRALEREAAGAARVAADASARSGVLAEAVLAGEIAALRDGLIVARLVGGVLLVAVAIVATAALLGFGAR